MRRTKTDFAADLRRDLKNPEFRAAFEAEKLRLEIALLLADARKTGKLSQKTLAQKLGTSQSAVARIESGRENFTIDTLGKIAAVLKRDVKIGLV